MTDSREQFNQQFQEYLRILYEGKWWIIVIFIVVVASTWIYTLQQDDIYSSRTTIRLKRSLDILNSPSTTFGSEGLGWGAERILNNEIRIIKSRTIADKVAEKLLERLPAERTKQDTLPILKARSRPSTLRKIARSLGLEPYGIQLGVMQLDTSTAVASKEKIIGRIKAQMNAKPVEGLDFIAISAESTSPGEAALIANLTAEAYQEWNLESSKRAVKTARDYLEEQLTLKRDSLREAEQELTRFQQTAGIVSLDAESQQLVSQLSGFEAQRDQKAIELTAERNTLNELRRQLAAIEPTLPQSMTQTSDPILLNLQTEKAQMEQKITAAEIARKNSRGNDELEAYYQRLVETTKAKIRDIDSKIKERTSKMIKEGGIRQTSIAGARELYQKIIEKEIEIQGLQVTLDELNKTVQEYSKKFEKIPQQSIRLARLERVRQGYSKLFELLNDKYQETLINEQTTVGNVEIIDEASVPGSPVRPNRPMNMLIGVIIGLGLGIAVAVGLNYLDNTIRTPEDVEKHGCTVLTFIPPIGSNGRLKRPESLVTVVSAQSPATEAYRTLRTSIENLLNLEDECAVVLVSSPAPKEGKSTIVANVAVSSAQAGRKVLLIDADMRRPVQHSIFEAEREPGLSECLVGGVKVNNCIRKTTIPGLHVMPSGSIPSHPAELLGSVRMKKLLEVLKGYYDFILLDAPPVIAMADTLIISRYTHGVVLVVSADITKYLGLDKARELLLQNEVKLLGVVVNRFNANKMYYSYYRYYYQNYYYYSENGSKRKRKRREKIETGSESKGGTA